MPKNTGKSKAAAHPQPRAGQPAAVATAPPPMSMPIAFLSLVVLAMTTATAASGVLVWQHFTGSTLPGCGEGSACDQATNSAWGRVPGWGLPVSILGVSYFGALLVGLITSAGRTAWSLRGLIWLGGFLSVVFIGVMLVNGWHCPYCLTAHIANLAFVALTEMSFRPRRTVSGSVGITFAAFAVLLGTFSVMDAQRNARIRAEDEKQRAASVEAITKRNAAPPSQPVDTRTSAQNTASPAPANSTTPNAPTPAPANPTPEPPAQRPAPAPETPATTSPPSNAATSPPSPAPNAPFTGRWRYGPEKAAIRIVMITDYQCPDCRMRERELSQIMKQRNDVSVSIKHYPFCTMCNPGVPNLHGNACFAAQAAETAGILGGPDAFWKMHQWLFERQGKFETNEQLNEGVTAAGLTLTEFLPIMLRDPRPKAAIQADIAEAKKLGLERTPMIFINGVELKGWRAPNALIRTVDDVARTNPPVLGPENDRPPSLLERFVALWNDAAVVPLPSMPPATIVFENTANDSAKPVNVVLWGDYEEAGSADADRLLRQFLAKNPGRYEFRRFPISKTCNPAQAKEAEDRHKNACRMIAAVEAANAVGGPAAARQAHIWLMENGRAYSDEKLKAAAPQFGVSADELLSKMNELDVAAPLKPDIDAGQQLGLQSLPWLYLNGKLVTRTVFEGQPVLQTLLAEAAKP